MLKKSLVFPLIAVTVLLIYLLGPRESLDDNLTFPELDQAISGLSLEQLDSYLAEQESTHVGIREGTEKTIRWASGQKRKTPFSVIYLHGYSSSRQEFWPIAQGVAAGLGANIYYTRFAGHGLSEGPDAFKGIETKDWLSDAYEALLIGRKLGENLIVMGVSNGGALSIWLTGHYSSEIFATVVSAPNFFPADSKAQFTLWPWGRSLANLINGGYNSFPSSEDPEKQELTRRYNTEIQHNDAVFSMMGVVGRIQKFDYPKMNTPLLIFYSQQDTIVNAKEIEAKFKIYSQDNPVTKELVLITESNDSGQHVLAGPFGDSRLDPFYIGKTLEFIRGLPKTKK